MSNERMRKVLLTVLALIALVAIVGLVADIAQTGSAGGWFLQPDVKPTSRA